MKKWLGVLCSIAMILTMITGCGQKKQEATTQEQLGKNQIYLYYVNHDRTDVVKKKYSLKEQDDLSAQVKEIIGQLAGAKPTTEYQSSIPEGISYTSCNTENRHGRIEVSFNVAYSAVDADTLLFFKASVVKTLLQLPLVNSVTLTLTDLANSDPDTATVSENFDQDSFTLSFGGEKGYKQTGTIILYFANETGDSLKEYRKKIEISNTTSLDRLVMESLIEGPDREGYQKTLPANTTIRNISVKDGICYVDLSDEFYNTDNTLKNDIVVYSIVNSLVELPTVSKVQFLKNGEKQQYFKETMEFDGLFERNLDLIQEDTTE